MSGQHHITLKLEGPSSQDGHVLLADLIDELRFLQTGLLTVDQIVDGYGESALDYKVVEVAHSKPLTITLQPTPNRALEDPIQRIKTTHSRFFAQIANIQAGMPLGDDMDNGILDLLKQMVSKPGVSSVAIKNGNSEVVLDSHFQQNLNRLLHEQDASHVMLVGKLEHLNQDGNARRFWLYPTAGAYRVLCDLPAGSDVMAAMDTTVEARGTKFYHADSPFPHRMDVAEIRTVDDVQQETLMSIRGMVADSASQTSSVEAIYLARDEWD